MSDSPEMFTVLNELHHAIEDGWHRHQYCSPVTENLRPQPLQLNLTVHADIAGDDELSDFLRKLRADLRDKWERSGSSHGVHADSLAALVDITAPYRATEPGTGTPAVYVVTPGRVQDVVSQAVTTWLQDQTVEFPAQEVSTHLAVTVHAENVHGRPDEIQLRVVDPAATPKPQGSDVVQQVQLYFDAGQLGEQHPAFGRLPTTPSVAPPIIVHERGVSAGDLGALLKPGHDHLANREEVASAHDRVVRPTPPPPDEPPPETRPAQPRFLTAQTAERVSLGRPLSLIVAITESAPGSGASSALKPLDIPPEGATVTVVVSAPGLTVDGELQQDIVVPRIGDPEPRRFAFVASRAGQHTLTIQAYRGGTFLGSVRTQVVVDVGVSMTEGKREVAELGSVAFEAGEVTLQVSHTSAGYSFQLLGDPICRPQFGPLADDPAPIVSQIAAELREMAAGRSPFSTAKQVKNRLTNLGVKLWSAVVPVAVQNQFWEQRDRIKTFTIVSDQDVIPWELLYPVNGANENGFLAEQFPVVRRTYGAGRRVQRIPMNSAAYVIPESSPENALTEVQKIRALLGAGVQDRGTLSRLDDVTAMIDDVPGVVHFACHNTFSDATGSQINLVGGPWTPTDLAVAKARMSLAEAAPLVFFNACRSAGETNWLSQLSGWATEFTAAGAGAFIGSLWAVRSSSALRFAEEFYQAFVKEDATLGMASLQARKAIAEEDGDPTWLAYTVYGNPAARAGLATAS